MRTDWRSHPKHRARSRSCSLPPCASTGTRGSLELGSPSRAYYRPGKCFRYESTTLAGLERLWDFSMPGSGVRRGRGADWSVARRGHRARASRAGGSRPRVEIATATSLLHRLLCRPRRVSTGLRAQVRASLPVAVPREAARRGLRELPPGLLWTCVRHRRRGRAWPYRVHRVRHRAACVGCLRSARNGARGLAAGTQGARRSRDMRNESTSIRLASPEELVRLESLWKALYEHQTNHGMQIQLPRTRFRPGCRHRPFARAIRVRRGGEEHGIFVGFVAGRVRMLPPHFGLERVGFIGEVFVAKKGARSAWASDFSLGQSNGMGERRPPG